MQRIETVTLAQDDLLRLSYRCFPSYRSLLLEYQLLLSDFAKEETEDLDDSLVALSETRKIMTEKAISLGTFSIGSRSPGRVKPAGLSRTT